MQLSKGCELRSTSKRWRLALDGLCSGPESIANSELSANFSVGRTAVNSTTLRTLDDGPQFIQRLKMHLQHSAAASLNSYAPNARGRSGRLTPSIALHFVSTRRHDRPMYSLP